MLLKLKKILVAEDELTSSLLLKRLLTKLGYLVVVAHNGTDAFKHIQKERFDIVLTDWMMPQMDGIELIRRIREDIHPTPIIIMITALVSESSKNYALESGADDFVAKPIDIDELKVIIEDNLSKNTQKDNEIREVKKEVVSEIIPAFAGCVIVTSTGGPPTLIKLLKEIPKHTKAAFYIVQHGPTWMLKTFATRLQKETELKVILATDGMKSELGNIYLAPGDFHLKINKDLTLSLDNGPKENFVKPAADPLFRTAARAFGKYLTAVILTGLGKDGTNGATAIANNGGDIIVQDPQSAIAPSMPRSIIDKKIKNKVFDLDTLPREISKSIEQRNYLLKERKKEG